MRVARGIGEGGRGGEKADGVEDGLLESCPNLWMTRDCATISVSVYSAVHREIVITKILEHLELSFQFCLAEVQAFAGLLVAWSIYMAYRP